MPTANSARDSEPDASARLQDQERKLGEIGDDLGRRDVGLSVEYSDTLHDREIRLDTGWVVKIGRGLDIYKPAAGRGRGRLALGQFDLDLRPCHETKVDIFHRSNLLRTER